MATTVGGVELVNETFFVLPDEEYTGNPTAHVRDGRLAWLRDNGAVTRERALTLIRAHTANAFLTLCEEVGKAR